MFFWKDFKKNKEIFCTKTSIGQYFQKEKKLRKIRFSPFSMFIIVLRIHLILLQILIRILYPHWKKMDPDPYPTPDPDPDQGYFFNIYWIFLTTNYFQILCLTFFAYFYPKTWWTIFADPDPGSQNLEDPTNFQDFEWWLDLVYNGWR